MEGCPSSTPLKDKNCPVCCQQYTHNQLRFHFRQYLVDPSKASNGHANFTPEDHRNMLKKLIAGRKLEKEETRKKSN